MKKTLLFILKIPRTDIMMKELNETIEHKSEIIEKLRIELQKIEKPEEHNSIDDIIYMIN